MSNTILIRRSATPGAAPTTGQISLGELAINSYDGRLYTKIDSGTPAIFELTQNQIIYVTGNVSGISTNNAANGTSNLSLTLSTTGVTANTYGGTAGATTYVGQFTVDQYGRITAASNVAISTSSLSNGTSELEIFEDGNIAMTVSGVGNVVVVTPGGIEGSNISLTGTVSASGNVTGGNIVTSAAVSAATVSASGNVTGGNIVTAGDVSSGGLVSVTGNITGGNIVTSAAVSAATVSASGNITGGNLITAGSLSAASFSASGNITGGNLITAGDVSSGGLVSVTGNVTGGNIVTAGDVSSGGLVSVTGNVTGGNIVTAGDVSSGGLVSVTGNVTGGNIVTSAAVSAATVSASGNVTGGNIVTAGDVSSGGLVSVTGNVTGGNIVTSAAVSAATVSASGNITGGNLITAGSLSAASFSASGNIDGGNINTAGLASVQGNVIGGNISTAGLVTASGNITGGNILTGGLISATSTITSGSNISGGNILTGGLISATGNITGGNVNTSHVVGSGAFDITAGGEISLVPTGNVVLGTGGSNVVINNVADPVQDNDAANKLYVDSVAQGLDVKPSCLVATANTLAVYSGGTISYDNGTGGIGATLTTTGTFTTIDGVSVATTGTRILVKNESTQAWNGIYAYTDSTTLTRTTDFDNGSPTGEIPGGFTFIEEGSTNADTGWVCTTNSPVTVGTTAIVFTQFSGAGTYTAGDALSLDGTEFNVNVDTSGDNTIGINGSNELYIPANATLTTPNIGAATGTSVSVTGNVASGNVNTGGLVSSTGNVIGGNINTGGLVLATGNITGGNISTVGIANIATLEVTTLANIKATTISTSTTTGALQVAGGVGVAGNIYAGAVYSGGEAVLTVNSTVDGGNY